MAKWGGNRCFLIDISDCIDSMSHSAMEANQFTLSFQDIKDLLPRNWWSFNMVVIRNWKTLWKLHQLIDNLWKWWVAFWRNYQQQKIMISVKVFHLWNEKVVNLARRPMNNKLINTGFEISYFSVKIQI